MPSASAPAPACTAPTGWPRTRSPSASSSAAAPPAAPPPAPTVAPPPTRETRKAMWRHAGLERDADGLKPLLDDPHPLARLVARCALHREETRGAHTRADPPATDPALDHRHTVVDANADEPRYERWE